METPASLPASGSGPKALVAGLRLGLHYWQVLLALWVGTLLAALPAAFVPARQLMTLADQPVMTQIADGLDTWQVLDVYGLLLGGLAAPLAGRESAVSAPGASPGLTAGLSGLAWAWLLVPLSGGMISAFLYGGMLLVYREAPAPFRVKRFLAGCWHWFGAFLLLGFLQAGLLLVGLLPVILLVFGLGARAGLWGILPAGLLTALGLATWLILFETASTRMGTSGRRNPFVGLRQALAFFRQHPGTLLSFYALALFGLLALHALYRLVLLPLAPLDLVVPAVLVQQSFILLRLFARAARLAGLVKMTAQSSPIQK